jgi:hypothetical protein
MIKNSSQKSLLIPCLIFFSLFFARSVFAIDSVRVECRIDTAIAKYGVTGQNVAVAIMDRGIDWKSNDFRNDDGTTRIAYIFDLTDDTGANWPNNPYGMGTIYSRAQIDSALNNLRSLNFRDAVGHGTTTSGILLGNGNNSVDKKWRGVAPNATIICIKIVTEGATAHDNQPAETPYYDPNRIPTAIDFAVTKSQELVMPCVMLLNLGSVGGPSDGTSELCRKIDQTVGSGIPGLVFVSGASDDGGHANHASYQISQGETDTLKIHKATTGNLTLDLWYNGNDRFDISINTPNGLYGPYTSPDNDKQITESNSDFLLYHNGSNKAFYNPTNNKREIWLSIGGGPGDYQLILTGSSITDGKYNATINPSRIDPAYSGNVFQNHVSEGSIWDLASASNNICPNDYVFRTSWIDIDGITRSISGEGNPGQLWLGSGVGPTFDGRIGIDVSAPGNSVVTTYSPTSYWATYRNNLIQGGNGLYGIANAVSAASPIVTGIIALMLQMNPNLDAAQVKQILHQSARTDSFTGTTPNTHWGYGKVDALNALDIVNQITGVEDEKTLPKIFSLKQNYPNPFNPSTIIKYSIPSYSLVKLKIYDILGREIKTLVNEEKQSGTFTVNFNAGDLASGVYFYQLQAGDFVQTKKLVLMK